MSDGAGFAVLYRWRVEPGREGDCRAAWERLTRAIHERRGGLGSRLHVADDGTWVAYARWPDRATWERAVGEEPADPEASVAMRACIRESLPPEPLTIEADLLTGTAAGEQDPRGAER
jgi:hypothetical protein